MSTQAVFTPNPPFLVSVLYDSTVREALDAIWEFLKSDFQRRDIALNQLSLRALSSPIPTKPWNSVSDRVNIAYNSGFVTMEHTDKVSQHSILSDSIIQLVLHISTNLPSLPTNILRAYQASARLHSALWQQNLMFSKTFGDEGENWACVDERYVKDLREFGYTEDALLIRQEYDTTINDLQYLHDDAPRKGSIGVVVTGKPGIGKTCFLYYLLLYLLHKRTPVSLEWMEHIFVFQSDGVDVHGHKSGALPVGCWALSDSNHRAQLPCVTFEIYALRHTAWIVQTTSPSEMRWKEWTKQLGASFYVMKPYSLKEMRALGKLLDLEDNVICRIFNTWGSSARDCIRLSKEPTDEGKHEGEVQSTAESFVTGGHSMINFDAYRVPHRLFSVGPKDDSAGGRRVMVAEFATRRIETIIAHTVASAHAEERIKFYDLMSKHKWLRSSAGRLFELIVLSWLSASSDVAPLTCIPAIEGDLSIDILAPGEDATVFIGSESGTKKEVKKMMPDKETLCLLPLADNFPTADAIVLTKDHFITIQVTIADEHSAGTGGFAKIKKYFLADTIKTRKWCHVFITDKEKTAESLRKPLPKSPGIRVYSAVFDYGRAKGDSEANIKYEDMKAFEEKKQRAKEAQEVQDGMNVDEEMEEEEEDVDFE